jgi:hypothetical protein
MLIMSFLPLNALAAFKMTCKILGDIVFQFCQIEFQGITPPCEESMEILLASNRLGYLYRLYDFRYNNVISKWEYGTYKQHLGITDDFLVWIHGDRFTLEFGQVYLRYLIHQEAGPPLPIRLCNFTNVLTYDPTLPYQSKLIAAELSNLSEKLQLSLVSEFPPSKFDLEALLHHRVPLSIMMCFGGRVVHEKLFSPQFTTDHMYIRSLLPFFEWHGLALPEPFFIIQDRTCHQPVDDEKCTSMAKAFKCSSYREWKDIVGEEIYPPETYAKIHRKIRELDIERKIRDRSPARIKQT